MPTTPDLDALLSPVIDAAMREMLVPGAVVHVRIGSAPPLHKAYGYRDLGKTRPMTVDDHVRIGSNTKTMTGTVVLKLIDHGAIGSLDDPVSKYRPDVPNGNHITIRDLLDMRSGLENYSARKDVNALLDSEPTRVWQNEDLVRLGIGLPPHAPPRETFYYSNTNTILLGLIAKAKSGRDASLVELFREWIFAPLDLKSTSMPPITSAAIPDPHPRGYMFLSNVETMASGAIPPDVRVHAFDRTLQPADHTDDNPSWTWAAGGAISTLGDLVTYVEALVKGALISSKLQAERLASLRPTSPVCSDPCYGLGLARFGPYVGHDGTLPGFQSFMGHDPDTDSTIVVATNLTYAPDGRETANAIVMAILAALNPKPPPADEG